MNKVPNAEHLYIIIMGSSSDSNLVLPSFKNLFFLPFWKEHIFFKNVYVSWKTIFRLFIILEITLEIFRWAFVYSFDEADKEMKGVFVCCFKFMQ